MIRIEKWSVGVDGDGYRAPELCGQVLHGEANHPRLGPGPVRTSRIKKVDGRTVTTSSGSVYELGEPHPDYLAKFPAAGHPSNPIKVCK